MVRHLSACLLFGLMLLSAQAQATSFTASTDRTTLSAQDTFTLLLHYGAQAGFGSPELTPLQKDFQILNQQQSRKISTVNGKTESYTDWIITLSPKRTGQLTIPPIEYNDEKTTAIIINVQPLSDEIKAQQKNEFFFDISVSQQDNYYVQGQILYTEKLYYSINHDEANLSDFQVTDARVQALGDIRQYTTQINGQRFGVYERRYAIFPEVSGELVIPGQRFNAMVRDPYDRWSRGRQASVVSKPIRLNIKPIPDHYPQAPWLPADQLQLTEHFSTDLSDWKEGEPVTRTITITANGLPGSQLPTIDLPAINQIRYYPDQSNNDEQLNDNGVTGTSVQSMALVPTEAGKITLPEIRIPWWNSQKNTLEYATLPAHTINISAAAQASASNKILTNSATKSGSSTAITNNNAQPVIPLLSTDGTQLFSWLSILLLALSVLINVLLLILLFKRPEIQAVYSAPEIKTESIRQAWKNVSDTCRQSDIKAIHTALIRWANVSQLSSQPLTSLPQLAACYQQPAIKTALAELDALLFSGQNNSVYNGQNLLSLLKQYSPDNTGKNSVNNSKNKAENTVDNNLYPF